MTLEWFGAIAAAHQAKVAGGGIFKTPELRIRRDGFEAVVKLRHPLGHVIGSGIQVRDEPLNTTLTMDAKPRRDFDGYLQVSTEGAFSFLARMFGSREIDVGEKTFDALYRVTGCHDSYVRRMLPVEVRNEIRALGRYGNVRLSQRRQGVTWTVGSADFDTASYERALDAFVKAGLRIMDIWCGTVVEVSADDMVAAASVCPVCGGPADRERVVCARCGVPQHRACWDYVGRCAIYGCGSEKAG